MNLINLIQSPNQKFDIQLGGSNYSIEIKDVNNFEIESEDVLMTISITRNDIEIISGFRLLSTSLIIPYRYLEEGNFSFYTPNDEYPDWRQFGITNFLYYFTAEEMEAFRA